MSDLIHCTRCKDNRAAIRFEEGEDVCRDCKRLPPPRQMNDVDLSPYSRKLYKETVNTLAKLPEYKRYREEHSLMCAQLGSAYIRGVGHVDK